MKKNGFTLIELIAVIGILAVILVIAVPKVNDYIKEKKEDNFLISARNIVRQIEYDNMDISSFNGTSLKNLNIENLSKEDYDLDKSVAVMYDGEIYLNLVGKGTYKGMYLCDVQYTSKNIEVQYEECENAPGGGV